MIVISNRNYPSGAYGGEQQDYMEHQKDNEQRPVIYPLRIPLESRIRFVSETDPEIFQRYGFEEEVVGEEQQMIEEPTQSELRQTAEILCKLSDSPTIHSSPTSDPLRFLTEASRYTVRPIYPPICFPPGQGIISYPTYPTFPAHPHPAPLAPARTNEIPTIELISEEEWTALTSPELIPPPDIRTCSSPIVEEFLQTYLPPDTPAEDRQGWYEFLCEDGGNEDCWSKFLGGDSGTEFHYEWLEDSGYQEGRQDGV